MRSVVRGLALLTAILLNSPLHAADDVAVVFSDDFATLKPGWGAANATKRVEGNKLLIKLDPDSAFRTFYETTKFDDADIRVRITLSAGDADQAAGLAFWSVDRESCYAAMIGADGSFYVSRRKYGKWLTPVNFLMSDAV